MKISREINGKNEEINLTAEELSAAYYEQEHLFDIEDCRKYVENETDYDYSLLIYYLDKESYKSFFSEMAYNERRGIDKVGLSDLDMPTLMEEVFWQTFDNMDKMEMPDKSISVKDMFDYGYTWGGMLPVSSKEIAMELFKNMEVFALYHDGSESLRESEKDFDDSHIYGVHKADWKKYLHSKANAKSRKYSPDISTILHGGKQFCYMFLDRLRSDCDYFLGCGNANEKSLWTGDVNEQISMMEDIYTVAFNDDEKPQWINLEQIRAYRVKMLEALRNKVN